MSRVRHLTRREEARTARGDIEAVLDVRGWGWAPTLSRWIDALLVLEESA